MTSIIKGLMVALVLIAAGGEAAAWKPCSDHPPAWVRGDPDLIRNHGYCDMGTHKMVLCLPDLGPPDKTCRAIFRAMAKEK
jgi:hypothetical protein